MIAVGETYEAEKMTSAATKSSQRRLPAFWKQTSV